MGDPGIGDEFQLIAKYFAPLAAGAPGALGLTDDAAVIDVGPGEQLVAAVDALVAGIHFLADDPPADIACKIVRVNLSDLAAMGARPVGLFLAAVFPRDVGGEWLGDFSQGLAADVKEFSVPLMGGDTVAGSGPLTLSVTALGAVSTGTALTRSGAMPGDGIFVSGTIGDGALGLDAAQGGLEGLHSSDRDHLIRRYRRPEPRIALGMGLIGLAHAAIDISDGLLADLEHICVCSGAGARIEASEIPLSSAGRRAVELEPDRRADILSGGDDYELLFTVPGEKEAAVRDLGMELGVPVTKIGVMTTGDGVEVEDAETGLISLARRGYKHFR